MAELATIARPYADALFEVARTESLPAWSSLMEELAVVADDEGIRHLADNPRVADDKLLELLCGVVKSPLSEKARNFLRALIANGRLTVLPEIAAQFRALVNASQGEADAVVHSAFPLEGAALAEVVSSLEKRFGRKLNATVKVDESLIGGVRVEVGDEVIDASVKARLERMRVALSA